MSENYKNFEILVAPTYDQAKELEPDITVEAEYGNLCVEGKEVTLAHHGPRSDNPPPCDTPDVPEKEGGRIVLSHLDLDAIGGVLAVTGDKPDDPEFWKAAGYVDVHGPHHITELPEPVQEKLNAYYAWSAGEERLGRIEDVRNVKEMVGRNLEAIKVITDPSHEKHKEFIEKGKEWRENLTRETEKRCVFENNYVRCFETDSVPCSGAYFSPEANKDIPCTVVYNTKAKTISIGFYDGGKEAGGKLSAKEIAQELWGPGAGGRDGIAGSPRGQEMKPEDFEKAKNTCIERVAERVRAEQNHEVKREEPKR